MRHRWAAVVETSVNGLAATSGMPNGDLTAAVPAYSLGCVAGRPDMKERPSIEAALISALVDNIPDCIYFKDAGSRFTLVNQALAVRFGLKRPVHAVGKTDFDFFTAEHAREAYADEQEVMRSRRPLVNKEEKETWPDGTHTWVCTTKLPLFDKTGQISGTCGISREITAQKLAQLQLAASERRYQLLLAAISSYTYTVTVVDGKPQATEHSQGAVTVTGYTQQDYEARSSLWLDMIRPEDRGCVLECVRRILAGESVEPFEHRIVHKDGSLRWVRHTVVSHCDSRQRLTRYDGLLEDITRRKEPELVRQRERERLEQCVVDRTAELAQAMARVQEHERAMAEFVANVTHELQSPVASITFAVENLLKGVAGTLPGNACGYCHAIKEDCQRLESTIGDVLELSRINAKMLVLHRQIVDVGALVGQVVERVRFQAQGRGQTLIFDPGTAPIQVDCDPARIHRAVLNVLRNAVKFTPEHGCIAISVNRLPYRFPSISPMPGVQDLPEASAAVVSVVDTGVGIAADQLARVTERYFRGNPHTAGTGLGLAICKEIVEAHGGTIGIRSPPTGQSAGTEVAIALPSGQSPMAS